MRLPRPPATPRFLRGWSGPAFLDDGTPIVVVGPLEDRQQVADLQVVADTNAADAAIAFPDDSTPHRIWMGNAWRVVVLDDTGCLEAPVLTVAHTDEICLDLGALSVLDRMGRILKWGACERMFIMAKSLDPDLSTADEPVLVLRWGGAFRATSCAKLAEQDNLVHVPDIADYFAKGETARQGALHVFARVWEMELNRLRGGRR